MNYPWTLNTKHAHNKITKMFNSIVGHVQCVFVHASVGEIYWKSKITHYIQYKWIGATNKAQHGEKQNMHLLVPCFQSRNFRDHLKHLKWDPIGLSSSSLLLLENLWEFQFFENETGSAHPHQKLNDSVRFHYSGRQKTAPVIVFEVFYILISLIKRICHEIVKNQHRVKPMVYHWKAYSTAGSLIIWSSINVDVSLVLFLFPQIITTLFLVTYLI